MPTRNRKLQQLKKRYPNINKFPLRPDPLYMENMKLCGKVIPTGFAKNKIDMATIMNEVWAKKRASIHRCPSCGNFLNFNLLNVLAKAVGVYHTGAEYYCVCGKGYRFMLNRDHAKAEEIRKRSGL